MTPPPMPPRAKWRGLTNSCLCCGDANLSFELEDGSILRLRIDAEAQRHLSEVCAQNYMVPFGRCDECQDQSGKSSDISPNFGEDAA